MNDDKSNEVQILRHEVSLEVEIGAGMDPITLEREVWRQGQRAARGLYLEAARVLDEQAVEASKWTRERLESRSLITLFGPVRLQRYRVRGQDATFHPLDDVLGLRRLGCSPGLANLVAQLSPGISLRRIAEIVGDLTDTRISPQTVQRLLSDGTGNPPAKDGTRPKQEKQPGKEKL